MSIVSLFRKDLPCNLVSCPHSGGKDLFLTWVLAILSIARGSWFVVRGSWIVGSGSAWASTHQG